MVQGDWVQKRDEAVKAGPWGWVQDSTKETVLWPWKPQGEQEKKR